MAHPASRLLAPWLAASLGILAPAHAGAPDDSRVRITILYDNTPGLAAARAAWGFSCLAEAHGKTVLFDAGGSPPLMRHNLSLLRIDTSKIDAVIFSHQHGDHTAGIPAVPVPPGTPAYIPEDFQPPKGLPPLSDLGLRPIAVTNSTEIFPGIRIGDTLHGPPPEISLAIDSPEGLVLLTGCAHPGIVAILKDLSQKAARPIHAVIGGFHLLKTPDADVRAIIAEFRKMGVRRVGATHCTGEPAIRLFREAYGADFIACGPGTVIILPDL